MPRDRVLALLDGHSKTEIGTCSGGGRFGFGGISSGFLEDISRGFLLVLFFSIGFFYRFSFNVLRVFLSFRVSFSWLCFLGLPRIF